LSKRISTAKLRRMATDGEKIVMVTCYDATFARLVDEAGVDAILVGDSLGMVIQGHEHTIPVTLDDVIYHSRAVARGCSRPHLVGDLPFGSYQTGTDDALRSAARLMKEGGVQAVKLEGGEPYAEAVHRMTTAGIPVMGHLGLTPQSVHQFGGYKIQGRTQTAAVTAEIGIPTIGIGAGGGCSGQVLVLYDLLGLDDRFNPKFLKKFDNLQQRVVDAVGNYAREVRTGDFPTAHHSH
jgi:3-methyl-2-oxobutanoate hydroxymethyltransferase